MATWFERHANRSSYRVAIVGLLAAAFGLGLLLPHLGAGNAVTFLVVAPILVTELCLTYARIKDAGLHGGWMVLAVLVINHGLIWDPPGPISIHWTTLINFIPMLIGWFAPSATHAAEKDSIALPHDPVAG